MRECEEILLEQLEVKPCFLGHESKGRCALVNPSVDVVHWLLTGQDERSWTQMPVHHLHCSESPPGLLQYIGFFLTSQ